MITHNPKSHEFKITLISGKFFMCDSKTTIFEAAKNDGIILEHSCLIARCRSCAVQVKSGTIIDKLDDFTLASEEKSDNWALTCNAIPTSDLLLNTEGIAGFKVFKRKVIPVKVNTIIKINDSVIKVSLRMPPNSDFGYNSGQYVNITKGNIKRSYSIANAYQESGRLTFLIKKYDNGEMSNYWFEEAKVNDLLRIEGPIGSFFLRDSEVENIIFLATGTGIAPIIAILESMSSSFSKYVNKKIWIFFGARMEEDLFWDPSEFSEFLNLKFIPVLSKGSEDWNGEKGYVQDIVVKQSILLENAQVYACGSNAMIKSAKKLLIENGLNENNFFSDAFLATN